MDRQESPEADTWAVETREDGVWTSRPLPGGWLQEHRHQLQGGTAVIVETRVTPWDAGGGEAVPAGGMGSDVLRLVKVGGAREAAMLPLLRQAGMGDGFLRDIEPAGRRQAGEPRLWTLAITSILYAHAVGEHSPHPNEDVGALLGVPARTVRDRVYEARRTDPPLLTGGGGRGRMGTAVATDAASAVLNDRLRRVAASLGLAPGQAGGLQWEGTLHGFMMLTAFLVGDAQQRIPGLWELGLDEIARIGRERRPPWVEDLLAGRKAVGYTTEGLVLVDRPGADKP